MGHISCLFSRCRRILTGSWDATAKIWDAETGREHFTLKGHTSSVSSIAFSYDGRRILTGSYDNTAKVWMAASPEEAEAWLKEQPEWQQKVEEQEKRKLRTLMADLDSAITQKN